MENENKYIDPILDAMLEEDPDELYEIFKYMLVKFNPSVARKFLSIIKDGNALKDIINTMKITPETKYLFKEVLNELKKRNVDLDKDKTE